MSFKLTFMNNRHQEPLEAEDATGILNAWNALPWWAEYEPADFLETLVNGSGAEVPGGMPAADEEILVALVEALDDVKLETI